MYAKLETRTFLAMLVGVSLAFVLLMKPFFGPIFWAVAIALIFYPVNQFLARRLGRRPNINALITLVVCMVIVVIP
ncbi:MAG TPA: AI-2E family transporter, partial [Marinobacter sp.]|nr:AI-2E family transporter [Marinobacter sp.]